MKRFGNIYSKIYEMDNLREAHRNARKDKLFYREVQMVDSDPDYYLGKIQQMLKDKTYQITAGDYSVSTINDKGKERELWKLPYYPHRIIQWAIMLQIERVFQLVFTDFVCASLPNRGIHRAMTLVNRALKDEAETKYCLKVDIHHFYPNIDHAILKRLLRRKFKDPDLLAMLDMIIDSHPPKGIPIGSYLSQYLANYYLAFFDHWLKETLKVKYVVRYMDDIIVLSGSKEYLHWVVREMMRFLDSELNLELKDNWQIFPTEIRGVDFIGYRFFRRFTLLRKKTCKRFKKLMLKIRKRWESKRRITYRQWCAINSYNGWLKWCDSFRLREKYITPIQDAMTDYYMNVVKKGRLKHA